MTLDRFDYVQALAEERNVRKASARLNISQPGLTVYINRLEDYLGVKLFDRSVSPIQITEAGELYLASMKEIQKTEAVMRGKLRDIGEGRTTFKIGISVSRGMHWLPIIIPEFIKRFPKVSICIVNGNFSDLEKQIEDKEVDVAFGNILPSYADLCYEDLRTELVYCLIPRNSKGIRHLKSCDATIYNPMPLRSEYLEGCTLLMPSLENGYNPLVKTMLHNGSSLSHVDFSDVLTINDQQTAYQLVASGCGALVANAFDYHRILPELDSRIAFFLPYDKPFYRTARMVFREDNTDRKLIDGLLEIIREKLIPVMDEGKPEI